MKNVDKLYKNYYNAYKSDYDTDDELKEYNKISKESKLDEKTKGLKLTELPKWIKVSNERFNVIKNET